MEHRLAHVGGKAGGVELKGVGLREYGEAKSSCLCPAVTSDLLNVGLNGANSVKVDDALLLTESNKPTQMDLRLTPRPNAEVATITCRESVLRSKVRRLFLRIAESSPPWYAVA